MKLLRARRYPDRIALTVHLDETKTVEGAPDPDWVRTFTWPVTPPSGVTAANYLAAIKQEARLLCQQDLDARQEQSTSLPGEGQTL